MTVSVRMATFETAFGWMAVVWTGERVRELTFGQRNVEYATRSLQSNVEHALAPNTDQLHLVNRIQAYTDGTPDNFLDVHLETTSMSGFRRRVVQHCRRIGIGTTASYGELAAKAGSPRAARAVGSTMAANRYPLIVPCHRVIGCKGRLGGFSAPDGIRMKRRLLAHESSMVAEF